MSVTLRWAPVFLSLSMLACGDDGDSARPDLDAGTPPGLDAAAQQIDATVDMKAPDASVDSAVVASGSCAVVSTDRIELPAEFGYGEVRRVLGGFVLSAGQRCWEGGRDLLFSLAPGAVSRLQIPASDEAGLCAVPGADDSTHPALVVTTYTDVPGNLLSPLHATAWRGTPPVPGTTQTIGEAFYRGTVSKDGAPSFDGKRAVFASGHQVVDAPDAMMLGLDGVRIGEVVSLGVDIALSGFNCLAVSPTEHGAIVSLLDNSNSDVFLRLVALGADGAVIQTVIQRLAQPAAGTMGCPLVVSSPSALLVALPRTDGSFQVVELSAGQVHEILAPTAPTGTPRWIAKTDDGGLLWLESTEDSTLRMLHVSTTGTMRVLAANLGAARALPGESGRLFLIREVTSGTQSIDEIVCNP